MDRKSSGELRDGLADVLNNAQLGIPTEVTSRGKRVAMIIPPEAWDKYLAYVGAELRGLVQERQDEQPGPLNDVLTDVVSQTTGAPAVSETETAGS